MEELIEASGTLFFASDFDLVVQFQVITRAIDGAEHADRFREVGVPHAAQQVGQARLRRLFVVEQQIVLGDALAEFHDFRIHAVEADTLVPILAENQRLAVFQFDGGFGLSIPVGGVIEAPSLKTTQF